MYNINIDNFAKQLMLYRKNRKITLETLGNKIHKSKSTVSKYEKGKIIPDIITVLEICNILDIDISQLFPSVSSSNVKTLSNPFKANKLYVYYYTENFLITSILEIFEQKDSILVKFYNGIKDVSTYLKDLSYLYEGTLICDNTVGYINLYNSISTSSQIEKLQISFNIPWSKSIDITNFFILALSPNSLPIVKKGIISTHEIKELKPYGEDLKISDEEIKKIQLHNAWILENKNYNHFFFDV